MSAPVGAVTFVPDAAGGRSAVADAVAGRWQRGVNVVTTGSAFAADRYRSLLAGHRRPPGAEVVVLASQVAGDRLPPDLATAAHVGPPPSPGWLASLHGRVAPGNPEAGPVPVFVVGDRPDPAAPPADRLRLELVHALAVVSTAPGPGDEVDGPSVPGEEWEVHDGSPQGTLPLLGPVSPAFLLGFAGRRWWPAAAERTEGGPRLVVRPGPTGAPPAYGGTGWPVSTAIRSGMAGLLAGAPLVAGTADAAAATALDQARAAAAELGLTAPALVQVPGGTWVVTWSGDAGVAGVALALAGGGCAPMLDGVGLTVVGADPSAVRDLVADLASRSSAELARRVGAVPLLDGAPRPAIDLDAVHADLVALSVRA